nr:Endoglucanase D Endo-1,4-beta-glucanase D; Cellulase D; EGCCD; Flags: Precursor [Salmonella sp. NCTC 7297]
MKIYYALPLHLPGGNMLNTCYHRGKNFRGVVFKPLIASLLLTSAVVYAQPMPLTATRYAQQLGVGMDVDWARTERGIREFDPLVVRILRQKG